MVSIASGILRPATVCCLLIVLATFSLQCLARNNAPQVAHDTITPRQGNVSEKLVDWDESSLIIRGERIMLFSAEFHPWRLPSPGLWLDIFQKVKAIGFSGVSFYLNWALLEGEPGQVRTEGVFALKDFFSAAEEAGIYLWARPGPYINSEVSGGGLPGWLQRNKARRRSTDPAFIEATEKYIDHVGSIISQHEISKGGPVILFQPENEYSLCEGTRGIEGISKCLDPNYMELVQNQYRRAGITLPMHSNDGLPLGNWRPGSGKGEMDIYGFDFYPLSWGERPCSNTSDWNRGSIPSTLYTTLIRNISLPSSPRSVVEFQGGSPDPWGGVGVDGCAGLINEQFQRVFYKINYSLKLTIMNLYMTFGGTNWGNIGHPEGYTSYDVGAAIREDRTLLREKYAELKLQANFFRVTPAYLTSRPLDDTVAVYTDAEDLLTTPLIDDHTSFYIVRNTDIQATNTSTYRLRVPTSRDSKIHVVDYDIDGLNLVYSSGEIFSWSSHNAKKTLILYGGLGETHEFALPISLPAPSIEDAQTTYRRIANTHVIQWRVNEKRRVIRFGEELDVYLLWRNDAYHYWSLDLPAPSPLGLFNSPSRHGRDAIGGSVIIKAGYLLRNASILDNTLLLTGDVNATTELEIISAPTLVKSVSFNGHSLDVSNNSAGNLISTITYTNTVLSLPDLSNAQWSYRTSLPEIESNYDDSQWISCDLESSNNPRNLSTPTSLYASDYGFHAGSLIYRGHFTATGNETKFNLTTQGALAYGHSVWLDQTFLGSFHGEAEAWNHTQSFDLKLIDGHKYAITVVIDHMGLELNFYGNTQRMKNPRGILDYALDGRSQNAITWKMTGNLGGEQYHDKSRGPLNEGAMYAERQGLHLPGAPTKGTGWNIRSPLQGISSAGIGFFSTKFCLDIPEGYDTPLYIELGGDKSTNTTSNFRVQIFVNGWQFGKYVNNIGPQSTFPVPEGIINHHGENYLALTLWALDSGGASLKFVRLAASQVIQSGYRSPALVQGLTWAPRLGAY